MGATPFFLAAQTADAELMRLLASLGADPLDHECGQLHAADGGGGAGDAVAGRGCGHGERGDGGDAGALELGADINAVDNNGETAMHGAAYKNAPGAVEFLAEHGAKVEVWNRPNKQGWTPLIIAEGYRFGNFKPSPVTVAAIHRALKAAGAE